MRLFVIFLLLPFAHGLSLITGGAICSAVNDYRQANGVGPLGWSPELGYLADLHINNLIAGQYPFLTTNVGNDIYHNGTCDLLSWIPNVTEGAVPCCNPSVSDCLAQEVPLLTAYQGLVAEFIIFRLQYGITFGAPIGNSGLNVSIFMNEVLNISGIPSNLLDTKYHACGAGEEEFIDSAVYMGLATVMLGTSPGPLSVAPTPAPIAPPSPPSPPSATTSASGTTTTPCPLTPAPTYAPSRPVTSSASPSTGTATGATGVSSVGSTTTAASNKPAVISGGDVQHLPSFVSLFITITITIVLVLF